MVSGLPSVAIALLVVFAVSSSIASPTSQPACPNIDVRHEWRSFTYKEKKAWLGAIKCLSALPHKPSLNVTGATPGLQPVIVNSSRYDDVVYTHMDAVNSAHFTGRFLAWHRLYLHTMHSLLKSQCDYTGQMPYWDWSRDSADIAGSAIWGSDPEVGLGAFGNPSKNFSVDTGALRDLIRAYPERHTVQRQYALRPFEQQIFPWQFNLPRKEANTTQTPAEWKKIVTSFTGNYTAFQAYVDGFRAEGLHNAAHISLGGDMSNVSHSPNDWIFWLLHGNLDRLYAAWQAHHPANFYAIGGGETQALDNFDNYPAGTAPWVTKDTILYMSHLGPDAKVQEVFDTQGPLLCYRYATLT